MHQLSLIPGRIAALGGGLFAKSIFQQSPDAVQLERVFSYE